MSMRARDVLDAIDDAMVLRSRNPVLFARLARRGGDCWQLQTLYDAWFYELRTPAWAMAYVSAPATRRRAKRNRVANRAARKARKANR